MQFSLRSLLISFAVAGMGTTVFCFWYGQWFVEPDASAVGSVVAALFVSSLFGWIKAHKRSGFERVRNCVLPPLLVVAGIGFLVRLQVRDLMGSNTGLAFNACMEFARAEEAYGKTDWNKNGKREYARTLKELREKLAAAGSPDAIEQGVADAEWPSTKPFHGYYFKILTSAKIPFQHSYIDSNGRMTQGYAFIAWPARYDWTGRDQFLISHSGSYYQSDYGEYPENQGERITEFNPVFPPWVGGLE